MTRSLSQIVGRLRLAPLALALLTPALTRAEAMAAVDTPPTGGSLIGSPSLGPSVGRMSFGGLVGLELAPSGYDVGPRFTFEWMNGFMDLAPQLRLDLGARVGLGLHSAAFDSSLWVLDFVPDAKLRYGVTDELGAYGDLGLGLAFVHASVPGTSSTDVALTFQLGFGASYAITPNINLLGEIRFDFYTQSGAGTFISIPTVGVEFH